MSCAVYDSAMQKTTLTLRLPKGQRAALKQTAERSNTTESEVIRRLLVREFARTPFGERAADFIGCVESTVPALTSVDSFRDAIRSRNWRSA
jgi:hypothetical protein